MIERQLPIHHEIDQDSSITLRMMTDLYYPSDVYSHNDQIYQNIKFMLGNDFLTSGQFSISTDTITPILYADEKAQRLPQIKPSNQYDLKIADAQGLKLSMSSARIDAMDLYSRYLSTFRGSMFFEESNAAQTESNVKKDIFIFKRKNKANRMQIPVWGKDKPEHTKRTPYYIVQRHFTALGQFYFTVRLAVDTSSDSADIAQVSKFRTICELKITNDMAFPISSKTSPLDAEKQWTPWLTDDKEPHALVTNKVLETVRKDVDINISEFDLSDNRDCIQLMLLAGQAVKHSASTGIPLKENDVLLRLKDAFLRMKLTSGESIPMDKIFRALILRGEDFSDEVEEFILNLVYAYRLNPTLLIENIQASGLNQILPATDNFQHIVQRPLSELQLLFNPLSGDFKRPEGYPSKEELHLYARHMRYALGLASISREDGEKPLSCVVLRHGKIVASTYDTSKRRNNPYSRSIINALQMAAENLEDTDLKDCVVITPMKPRLVDAVAIRMRKGIKLLVYGIDNLIREGDEIDVLQSTNLHVDRDLVGNPPPAIAGLLQKEVLRFYEGTQFAEYLQTVGFDYYDAAHADSYAEMSRRLNGSESKEQEIILSLIGPELAGQVVLDAGCCEGGDTDWLKKNGATAYGADISIDAIRTARQRYPDIADRFNEASLIRLPYSDNFFDIIIGKYPLNEMEIPDIELAYREFFRCLKPGGKIVLIIHHPTSQMLSPDASTGVVTLDLFGKRRVNVKIFDGVVKIEPVHLTMHYLTPYFLEHFRLLRFIEDQDIVRIHPESNVPEMLVLMAVKNT